MFHQMWGAGRALPSSTLWKESTFIIWAKLLWIARTPNYISDVFSQFEIQRNCNKWVRRLFVAEKTFLSWAINKYRTAFLKLTLPSFINVLALIVTSSKVLKYQPNDLETSTSYVEIFSASFKVRRNILEKIEASKLNNETWQSRDGEWVCIMFCL